MNHPPNTFWRFHPRFSLLTLLLLMTIVAMGLALWQQHLEHAPQRDELRKLRDELGQLTIDDPAKPHAIEVATGEYHHWRWRVYIPEQGTYAFYCQDDHIPKSGIPDTTRGSRSGRLFPGEHQLDLWIEPEETNRDELKVRFTLFGSGTITPDFARSFSLTERKHDWIYHEATQRSTYYCQFVGKQTQSFDSQKPMVLFRLRPYIPKITLANPRGLPNAATRDDIPEPCEGLMIWIDQKP